MASILDDEWPLMSSVRPSSGTDAAPMPIFLAIPDNPSVRWIPVNCRSFHCDLVLVYREDKESLPLSEFLKYCRSPGISKRLRTYWAAAVTVPTTGERDNE